jgi:hypothetical protein
LILIMSFRIILLEFMVKSIGDHLIRANYSLFSYGPQLGQ